MRKDRIDIVFLDRIKIDKVLLRNIARRIIKEKDIKEKVVVSLIIVNDKIIREFNNIFRRQNKVTTILSFPLISSFEFITPRKEINLGDIVVNIRRIKKINNNFKENLKKNIVHAFLHLLSYNHGTIKNQKKMEKEEKRFIGALDDI